MSSGEPSMEKYANELQKIIFFIVINRNTTAAQQFYVDAFFVRKLNKGAKHLTS